MSALNSRTRSSFAIALRERLEQLLRLRDRSPRAPRSVELLRLRLGLAIALQVGHCRARALAASAASSSAVGTRRGPVHEKPRAPRDSGRSAATRRARSCSSASVMIRPWCAATSFVLPPTCGVWITLPCFDERMVGAGRLDRERVERRAREVTGVERGDERSLVESAPRARC